MKTASLGINPGCPKSSPLGVEEQEIICAVIQKAEQLDLIERERVRLLIRLFAKFSFTGNFSYFELS